MNNRRMTLTDFTRLLDVYGAERSRWPAEARAAAAQLVTQDAEARRLLAEAEALDCVLARAPVPGLAVEAALAERIVAAAGRSPRIVRLPGARNGAVTDAAPVKAAATPAAQVGPRIGTHVGPGVSSRIGHERPRRRQLGREAGAIGFLAASLLFGVVIGSSSLPSELVPAFADLAGLAPKGDLVQIALYDEVMR